MMNQLSLWQMIVDLGLITSVLTMAFRAMKSSRAQALLPQTLELEAALKNLIADADSAGKQLNDQLLRRESAIQKYLTELEESERRVARSVVEGEEVSKRIESISETAQKRLNELLAARGGKQQRAAAQSNEARSTVANQGATTVTESINASAARTGSEQPSQRNQQSIQRLQPTKEVVPNIQTSVPSSATQRQTSQSSPRASQTNKAAASEDTAELQKVYAAAEQMLREGVEFDRVAAQTKLPVEGVKMLSQMIEVDRSDESAAEGSRGASVLGDPRLGALGVTRRQTNV